MESISESSNRRTALVICLIFSVVLEGTLSLPVLKYPRAISASNYHRYVNGNSVESPRVKPVPDLIFEDDASARTQNSDSARVPVIDIYNDRIFFREPEPSPKNIFGYIRSFPSTSTSLPETVANRRYAETTSIPPEAATSEPTTSSLEEEKQGGSSREDILDIGSTEEKDRVPLAWLQDWVARNNYTMNETEAPSDYVNGKPINDREQLDIAFQSLFQVPSVKRTHPPCPPNLRRNHHGKCVRPVRIRFTIIEDRSDS